MLLLQLWSGMALMSPGNKEDLNKFPKEMQGTVCVKLFYIVITLLKSRALPYKGRLITYCIEAV